MDTRDMTTGFSWGWVIFIILILWFFAGGNGFGWGNRGTAGFLAGEAFANGSNGCSKVSNCEVERQGLITAAETNFRIIEENRRSTDAISAQLRAQWDADQGEKIFDLKMNNLAQQNAFNLALSEKNATIERMTLSNSMNARFDALASQIQSIQCNMLTKPNITGVGAVCPNAGIINGLGLTNGFPFGYNNFNGFNGCNSCCNSTLA